MASYPDEILMAYADGELTAEQTRELEAWLAVDPALRARLEPFTRTAASLAGAFDRPLSEPVPERLLAVVRAHAAAARPASARRAEQKSSFLSSIAAALFPEGLSLAGAGVAAGLVVIGSVIGVLAARLANHETGAALVASDDSGHLVATGVLGHALATAPSEVSSGSGATVVTPIKTFRDHDGRLCRQYELDAGAAQLAGVACRDRAGTWQIALHSERVAGKPVAGAYETAGSGELPAVRAAVAAMIAGEPLSPDDEKAVLGRTSKD